LEKNGAKWNCYDIIYHIKKLIQGVLMLGFIVFILIIEIKKVEENYSRGNICR
jgi:hypothetical protein